MGDRGGAAFEDLRHVPDDRRGKALEERQRGKERGVAAAPGDDDLRAGPDRLLDRLDPHHRDDVQGRLDIGLGKRPRGRQGPRPPGAQMLAHGLLRDFGMHRSQLEVEALFARDLAHDVEHEGEPRIGARSPGRADDQGDLGRHRAAQHDLGIALDRGFGKHAGAGGERTRPRIRATRIAADHPGAQFDRLVERLRAVARAEHPGRRDQRVRRHRLVSSRAFLVRARGYRRRRDLSWYAAGPVDFAPVALVSLLPEPPTFEAAMTESTTSSSATLIWNFKLLGHNALDGFGGMGEGMSMQLAKDGRRILWLAHESAPKNYTAVDVSDPRAPKIVARADLPQSHMRSNSLETV